MTARIHLEPLPTPFAPTDGPVSVATPSCCCCCCCVVTLAGTATHMAAEAYYCAVEEGGSRWGALTLAILAGFFLTLMVPAVLNWVFSGGSSTVTFGVGYVGATVLIALALAVARARRPVTVWTLALAPLAVVPLSVIEAISNMVLKFALIPLVLFVPVLVVRASRRRHAKRMVSRGGVGVSGVDPAPEADAEASGQGP